MRWHLQDWFVCCHVIQGKRYLLSARCREVLASCLLTRNLSNEVLDETMQRVLCNVPAALLTMSAAWRACTVWSVIWSRHLKESRFEECSVTNGCGGKTVK